MTSYELYKMVMEENTPIDWNWVRTIKRQSGSKGIMEMARHTTECFAPLGTSKNIITRASKMVYEFLN